MKSAFPTLAKIALFATLTTAAFAGPYKTYGVYFAWDNNFNNSTITWAPSSGSYP